MYPQKWTILRENPPAIDESTGNRKPVARSEIAWTGILQRRFLDTKQTEVTDSVTTGEMVLQLDPGPPGGLLETDRVRFDGDTRLAAGESTSLASIGDVLTIQGDPHVRRPVMGGPPQYVVAIVRRTSDLRST